MDQNLKALKKACKRDKRKNVTLWKSLAIFSLVVAILMGLASFVLNTFDNTMSLFLNDKFWTLENEDPNAIYVESEYKT